MASTNSWHSEAVAPAFADFVDELAKLSDGNIFVTHNVSFDYGLIGTEPKSGWIHYDVSRYCIVRETWDRFAGLSSYFAGESM